MVVIDRCPHRPRSQFCSTLTGRPSCGRGPTPAIAQQLPGALICKKVVECLLTCGKSKFSQKIGTFSAVHSIWRNQLIQMIKLCQVHRILAGGGKGVVEDGPAMAAC